MRSFLFSRGLRQAFALVGVCLLFVPKINIVGFSDESAGIRIDDLLIFGALFMSALAMLLNLRRGFKLTSVEKSFYWFFCWMIISNIANSLIYHQSSILYSIRMLEYFMFFYFGYYVAVNGMSLTKVLWFLLLINGSAIVLQTFGILGGFESAGYSAQLDRAIGVTGGPWEVGAVINLIFAYLIFNKKRSALMVLSLFVLTMALMLLTAARMPSLAHFALLAYYFYVRTKNKALFVLTFLVVLAPLVVLFVSIPNPVLDRSENVVNIANNIDEFSEALRGVDADPNKPFEFEHFSNALDADTSWLMRTVKWSTAISMYANAAYSVLWGVGPGHLGIALDGGWLRIFVEAGPVGLLLFLLLCKRIAALSAGLAAAIVAFCISMFMIDIYMAYKVMSLLFIIAGFCSFHYCARKTADSNLKRNTRVVNEWLWNAAAS